MGKVDCDPLISKREGLRGYPRDLPGSQDEERGGTESVTSVSSLPGVFPVWGLAALGQHVVSQN